MTELSGHPRSVLVIDDDPLMRDLLVTLLGVEGIAVHAAASGEEALLWLAEQGTGPEVVLTDVQMPDTDFAKLAPKLREVRPRNALLLGMSGSPAKPEELALLDGFLLKPFSIEGFLSAAAGVQHSGAGVEWKAGAPQATAASADGSEFPVLDMQVYSKMAASLKPEALTELYRIMLGDVRQRVDSMRSAHVGRDYETCRREAHAIKGGCGMVGAMELRSQAAAIEAGAPADTPALEKMEEACKSVQSMLDALL